MTTQTILLLALYFIEVIGFFLIGLLINLRKKTLVHKSFAIFAFLVGSWQLLQFLAQILSANHDLAIILLHASIVMSGPMVASFLIFTQVYIKKPPRYLLFFGLGSLAGLLTLFSQGINATKITHDGIGVPNLDFWYAIVLLFAVFCILYGVFSISLHLRASKDKKERRQDKILLLNMLLTGLVIILSSFSTSEFSNSVIGQHILPTAVFCTMLGYLYVMYRGLFDIHLFVVRAVAYLGTLFLLAVFCVLPLVFGLIYFFGLRPDLGTIVLIVIGSLAGTYLLLFLRKIFDDLTTKWFYRQFYNPQDVLDKLNNVLVRTIDIETLSSRSLKVLGEALNPHFIKLVLYGDHNKDREMLAKLSEASSTKTNTVVVDDLEVEGRDVEYLKENKVAALVRIHERHEEVGYLILGYKQSGQRYSSRDVRLLNIAADELALAIQNALRFEEIREFNKTLQSKITEATAELRESNLKLQRLDQAKDEFISMASHQLRTPLTSVKGYLSMVLEGDAGRVSADQHKIIQEAYSSAQRMVYLIGDFLNVSRLRTGKFVIEKSLVSLPRIVKEEIEQLAATAARRDIRLECHLPTRFPEIELDDNKIRQVIMNLIDNAIFYSKPGSAVIVELTTTAHDVSFKVHDTGIGVPEHERHNLFTKFFRASNARKVRPDGTGIGLFMAKKVIIAHGGSIIFESKLNKGSTFGFALPLSKKPVEQVQK